MPIPNTTRPTVPGQPTPSHSPYVPVGRPAGDPGLPKPPGGK
jgi:hypothetical protein